MLDRHPERIALAKEFGATDIVVERGKAAVQKVRELAGGLGAHSALECVRTSDAIQSAIRITRAGGSAGRVGVPQDEAMRASAPSFFNNITIAGGPAPARAYLSELLPDVLEGRIQPGKVFDWKGSKTQVPDDYRAMNDRIAIKTLIEF